MENFISQLQAQSEYASNEFSSLSEEQFNFKPSADKWSIAQCILHLVKTNKGYFPLYEHLMDGSHQANMFEKTKLFSNFWEKFFIKGIDPKNEKKMKAPASLQPGHSHIDKDIIDKLAEQNLRIADYYQKLESAGLRNTIVSSPFAKFIVYNVDCTFEIILLHEQRHLQQAKRVKDLL